MGLPIVEEKTKTKREHYEERVRQVCDSVPLEKIDPLCSAQGQVRIERTLELLAKHIACKGDLIADLGCGTAVIASLLADQGGVLTALDVSDRVLQSSKHTQMSYRRGCIPYLSFSDACFDGVIFTDVIAEIEPPLYRLTLSELARLLKRNGWMICSTQLDLYSHDAQERFIQLIHTEFEIIASVKSYHRLHFYLTRWVKAPARFVRAARQENYRAEHLQRRSGFMRLWFYLNSTKAASLLWRPCTLLSFPLQRMIKKNRPLLLALERLSKIIWGTKALTHLIVLARKKKI
jgi:ubiquinone/menaquinone biosynthesis C-methylase UbiE